MEMTSLTMHQKGQTQDNQINLRFWSFSARLTQPFVSNNPVSSSRRLGMLNFQPRLYDC